MELISNTEALQHYEKAYKIGKSQGGYLTALDTILEEKHLSQVNGINLGLVQIPINQIVGTKTNGRSQSFSSGFYPILNRNSEFASKWMKLCIAHLKEGIREPVKAYEYMNKFYIEEGNKRVSILKYFGAVSVPAYVTRILPPYSHDKETQIYYEFLDFYQLSGINYIWFSQEGSFGKLQRLVGKLPDAPWTEEEKLSFSSIYSRFETEFEAALTKKVPLQVGDAFLAFLDLYDYHTLEDLTTQEFKNLLLKSWDELNLFTTDDSIELQMSPSEEIDKKVNIFKRLLPSNPHFPKVAFINEKNPSLSGWTFSHELGRMHLQEIFGKELHTCGFHDVNEESIDEVLEQVIADGYDLIFTTSPVFLKASLKAAVDHPNVKILNCSLNTSYRHLRTYYARMYEPKFLIGAIAGCMTKKNRIGYIADYPIFGMTASINAFALGVEMVNPRAKIYLEWSTVKNQDIFQKFKEYDVDYVSGPDMSGVTVGDRQFGLYKLGESHSLNVAMPVWDWGKFYEQMVHNVMDGAFKYDDASTSTKALNYWWGISSGIVDVICSKHLPFGTLKLVDLLKDTIASGDFNPFSGVLYAQDRLIHKSSQQVMSPEDIITIDWLASNIIGHIPSMDELVEKAHPLVNLLGIHIDS